MNLKTFFKPTWAKVMLTFLIPFSFETYVDFTYCLFGYFQYKFIPLIYTIIEYVPNRIMDDTMHDAPPQILQVACPSFGLLHTSEVIEYSVYILIINYLIACLVISLFKKLIKKNKNNNKIINS